jgi:nondiscriminating aspartyl-tRNA synthetase
MERNLIKDIFNKKDGERVLIKGWVHDKRDLKKIRFIILKDISGRAQIVGISGETSEEIFENMDKLNRESVIELEGILKDSKQAPGGKEINPTSLKILAEAENPLPLDVSDHSKTELPLRLDKRFLDLHRDKTQAIFKIQSTIMNSFREYMLMEQEAIEVAFPSLIGASSEGGTDVFKVKYFEKEAFLSQSCQLYKQMVACSMEKVFTIFSVWRAEKHNTTRHLNESRQLDFEMAFADDLEVMKILSKTIQHIIKKVIEKNEKELRLLEIELKVPDIKYLTFAEVKEIMKKEKIHMGEDDLNGESEEKLGELFPDTVVLVHEWPLSGKPFYIMPRGGDPNAKLAKGFDAIYKGMEITSGGQRIHLPNLLIERLVKKGLDPEMFKDYIDSFRYGAPPHSGWGLGLERITMLILGLKNIREATMFPRDRDRLTP